jgi:hypothetical protein
MHILVWLVSEEGSDVDAGNKHLIHFGSTSETLLTTTQYNNPGMKSTSIIILSHLSCLFSAFRYKSCSYSLSYILSTSVIVLMELRYPSWYDDYITADQPNWD